MSDPIQPAPLAPYRVVELPGFQTAMCGKILADLGAEVIKVEPPQGDPMRGMAPFFRDDRGAEHSLIWRAYNRGKRGVTLALEQPQGREQLLDLAAQADFVLDGLAPGQLAAWGLGYDVLRARNPGLILVSVTPCGQTGPYKDFRGTDLIPFALGGYMHMCGDSERAPVRISLPQAYHHASGAGAAGALAAHFHRLRTGRGQHVDVSAQQVYLSLMAQPYATWDYLQQNLHREGVARNRGYAVSIRTVYPCKDGHLIWLPHPGPMGAEALSRMVARMREEGFGSDALAALDWNADPLLDKDAATLTEIFDQFIAWFRSKTKQELFRFALETSQMLAPVNALSDLFRDEQLLAREFFETPAGEHPRLKYPGPALRPSRTPLVRGAVAPAPGQHNAEVLGRPRATPRAGRAEHGLGFGDGAVLRDGLARDGLPLEGLKVIDFGTAIVGPLSARILSDCGAEVIKIETPLRPDVMRTGTPRIGASRHLDYGGYFPPQNAGKLGIALNLSMPEARAIALRLAAWADVLVETFTPRVMKGWGLDYAALSRVNPRLIMLSHCLQGQTGPRANMRGFGTQSAALTGLFELTGWPDRDPVGPFGAYPGWLAYHYTVPALLAALDYRRRTGKGQYIDQAQAESTMQFLAHGFLDASVNGHDPTRSGNRDLQMAPHGVFPCAGHDRWCAIAVDTEAAWRALCEAMGQPALAHDPRFADAAARKRNEDALERLIGEWTRSRDAKALMHELQGRGVPAGYVAKPQDLFDDPQLTHRQAFIPQEHAALGRHRVHAFAFHLPESPLRPRRPSPCLGEHTEKVLTELLGMSAEEVQRLRAAGALH